MMLEPKDTTFSPYVLAGITCQEHDVFTEKLAEIYCVESPENPALEPDLDDPWLVWLKDLNSSIDWSYLTAMAKVTYKNIMVTHRTLAWLC